MTDEQSLNTDSGTQTAASQTNDAAVNVPNAEPAEKILTQSEVDKIVGGVKAKAYEKAKMDLTAEQDKIAAQAASSKTVTSDRVSLSKEELKQVVEEHTNNIAKAAEEKVSRQQAEATVEQFATKVLAGTEKYADFEKVVQKLGITNFSGQLIDLTNSMDNTADLVYELAKNPVKFASIESLAERAPDAARDELMKLSASIKHNEEGTKANSNNKVNAPLDQLKPSATTGDSGLNTVDDFRKQPWLQF